MPPPVLSEILRSGFMIKSSFRRRTHLLQSFSLVFLYCATSSSSASDEYGSEEEKKNAIEPGIGEAVQAAEADALGRSHELYLFAEKREESGVNQYKSLQTAYLEMEAENSVLRAQLIELTKTLQSLKHICITSTTPRPPPPPPPRRVVLHVLVLVISASGNWLMISS
ncbi:hypothetical protein Sango_2356400 [Sesamum angolense]|uniref:Uncharacterized protein n=1 Tax=Sesamum angolense TaxID=2727404 RepID=A0AAE2BJA4_9LAMI|nr:hypothetical protein Sango_2356400 [Sesamum angolense]